PRDLRIGATDQRMLCPYHTSIRNPLLAAACHPYPALLMPKHSVSRSPSIHSILVRRRAASPPNWSAALEHSLYQESAAFKSRRAAEYKPVSLATNSSVKPWSSARRARCASG